MSSKLLLWFGTKEDVSDLYSTVVTEIVDGELSVLGLVEGLSSHLTSTDEEKRKQGVLLLSNVLKQLPPNHLNENEANVLAQFFCDRLKDRLTIIPAALKGLESISSLENIPNNIPLDIMLALSMNVTAQTLPPSSRLTYYAILKNLMFNKTEVLLSSSSDFVYAVISAMDSESDPRCLIYLFQFLPNLLTQFPLKHLTEETFSVLECYFPIDFNARDKPGVTRDDLAQGLQDCLLATPTFAPFIIPTVLEKLDSQLKIAHVDSLKLLIKGMEIWAVNDLKAHSSEIWRSLSKLLLPPSDNEVAELAVKTLVNLISTFNTSNSAYQELDQLLEDISASTHGFLSDPNLSLFIPTMKLLASVSLASERSCEYVIKTVLGQLLTLLEQTSGRDITLTGLSPILNASVRFNCWKNDSNRISKLLDPVPEKMIELLMDPKARSGSFSCLIEIVPHLTLEQRQKIMSLILETVTCELSPSDSEMCSLYIRLIGSKYPEEVKNNLLLKLNVSDNYMETKRNLDVFCWCCNVLRLTSYSVDKIFDYVNTTSSLPIIINCLRELCKKADEKVLIVFGTECKVPERLLTFALKDAGNKDKLKEETVINISNIVQAIVRPLNSSQQKTLLNSCLEQFLSPESRSFTNLDNNELFLLEGLICPLREDVSINMCNSLVTSLIDASINNGSYTARESASLILASIINKYQNDSSQTLDSSEEMPINSVLKTVENGKQKETILLLSWITKSLIMRGHCRANYFLNKLIYSLNVNNIQMEAAEGFKLILQDHESLSLKNYCIIKLLYKQRIFQKLNEIVSLLDISDNKHNFAVLLAVSYILQFVPKSLVISRLTEIIPVIVKCIDSNSSVVITSILEVIASLLESGEQIFEGYMDTFLPRCLSCVQTSNDMVVRMQALNCIYHFGTFKEVTLLPHRDKVLIGLEKSLDDKKRLVRKNAVRARNRWYLVGGMPDR